MRKNLLFLMLTLIMTTSIINAQTNIQIGGQTTELKTLSKTENGYQFMSTISEVELSPVMTTSGLFNDLNIEGYSRIFNVGKPQLPMYRKMIQLPYDGTSRVVVKSYDVVEINLNTRGLNQKIMPCQPSYFKNIDPSTIVFQYDQAFYQQNSFNEAPLATIEAVGTSRGVKMANVVIDPIKYNPVTNVLKVYTNIRFDVIFENHSVALTKAVQEKFYSPLFDGTFKTVEMMPLNLNKDALSKYPIKYVIVSSPSFQATLQPFIQWKTKKGFKVIEAYTNQANVGTTTTSIKAYLQGLYNAGTTNDPAPTFVLFVGDVAQVPAFAGTTGTHPTDLYYVTYDGSSDNIPDMYFGRFSATTVAQLQPQIDKTLMYEMYTMPNPNYLDTAVLVAGVDASYSPTHANGQINYASNYFNVANGYSYVYKYLYPETDNSATDPIMRANIGKGVGVANYTAHCSETGWADPSFQTSDIAAMVNKDKYGLIIGNCCLSNKFDETECFGEAMLRTVNKGAMAYIGGSNSTLWNEDYYWSIGLRSSIIANPTFDATKLGAYDRLFHTQNIAESEWCVTNGAMIYGGNLAVQASSSSNKKYYWEIYHIMGDPSVMTYLSIPSVMSVVYANTQNIGVTSLTVTTEPGAYVAVSLNGVLLNAKLADNSGIAQMTFAAINNVDTADVVVTKQNRQPYKGFMYIVAPSTPNDASANQITQINDTYTCINPITPKVTIKNMGTNALTSVNVYFKLDNNAAIHQIWTGNLASMASTQMEFPAFTPSAGNHIAKAWTSMPNNLTDGVLTNDTTTKAFVVNNLAVTSNFSANNLSACSQPLTVQFQNTSENGQYYLWNFGDGSASTDVNPSHIYTSNGIYTVTLTTSTTECGQAEMVKTGYIQVGLTNPILNDTSICGSQAVTITATGGNTINWYNTVDGTVPFNTGNTYTTPILTQNTTYYVESSSSNQPDTIGDSRNNASGGLFTSNTVHGLYLNCTQAVVLKSAVFNSGNTANKTFKLLDLQGNTVQQVSVNVPSGSNRVELNINIPVGTYKLVGPASPNLYRNNTGSTYPYTMPGIISIDSCTATGASATTYYYYFYNMIFQQNNCVSQRVPVNVTIGASTPANAGTISGNATVCVGTNAQYTVPTIQDAQNYIWTLPAGFTFVGNSNSNAITVAIASGASNGQIKVKGINGCGEGTESTKSITVSPLPSAAGIISGSVEVCPNTNNIIYSINPVDYATSYTWTIPTGYTFVGGHTSNTITVNAGSNAISDSITVTPNNACGIGEKSQLMVNILSAPQLTTFTASSAVVCPGQNDVVFAIADQGVGTQYHWSLPSEATGSSNTNSIGVDFSANFNGGNVAVFVSNTCGTSNSIFVPVSLSPTLGAAGTISGDNDVCQGTASVTYSIPVISNATEYVWELPAGVLGTSTTNTITVEYTLGAAPGNITVFGKNNCYQSNVASLAVNVNDLPYISCSITGSLEVCQNQTNVQYSIPLITNATSYVWTIPTGAIGTSTTNIINVNFTNSESGIVTVAGVNDCGSGTPVEMPVVVNPIPEASFTQQVNAQNAVFTNTSSYSTTYEWLFGDGNSSTLPSPSHTYNQDGSYTIRLVAFNNCSSDTTYNQVTINTQGIESNESSNLFEIYPNPSSTGIFNLAFITGKSEKIHINITNNLGQIIYSTTIISHSGVNTNTIDLSSFSKGLYFFSTSYSTKVQKISIQ